ncbi:N-myc-interactor isoform X1 [Hypanus sabinus]|nr:N-myc-interactor isoform X1 [Hypanus sabinus]XP_059826286.1 N-myc-interactor isoform X1 [Hypanus sabinus]XP_059826287.1 N-myc-interactor isoform X1 [Hypanus sabinus]XP_059826288.1 N-myc-interactor isoform X1 [Hypanus sabinus]XP_059826289.1 N-myc-interactor isoform X1 [Hypanus sabinus]
MDQPSGSNQPQPLLDDNGSLSFEITDVEGECQNDSCHLDSESICQAKEELERWQKKLDKLDKEKVELTLQKLDADEKKNKAENELKIEQENSKHNRQKAEQSIKEMIHNKMQKYDKLKAELVQLENELQLKQDLCDSLCDKFKFKIKLPQMDMKFVKSKQNVPVDQETDEFLYTKGIYTIIPKMSVLLQNGQALITFEEEQVAHRIQRIGRHHVDLQSEKIQVNAYPVKLDATQHFQIHLDISMNKVRVSEIPDIIPEEQMRDKLEISFSKPSLGGGEVESINYFISSGTAEITFVDKWVARRVTELKKYPLLINGQVYCMLTVESITNSYLQKFQKFNGVCKRTLLLSDIKSTMEEEELQDKLKIHFQKPSKQGGEVEDINYVPKDKHRLVYLEEDSSEK